MTCDDLYRQGRSQVISDTFEAGLLQVSRELHPGVLDCCAPAFRAGYEWKAHQYMSCATTLLKQHVRDGNL